MVETTGGRRRARWGLVMSGRHVRRRPRRKDTPLLVAPSQEPAAPTPELVHVPPEVWDVMGWEQQRKWALVTFPTPLKGMYGRPVFDPKDAHLGSTHRMEFWVKHTPGARKADPKLSAEKYFHTDYVACAAHAQWNLDMEDEATRVGPPLRTVIDAHRKDLEDEERPADTRHHDKRHRRTMVNREASWKGLAETKTVDGIAYADLGINQITEELIGQAAVGQRHLGAKTQDRKFNDWSSLFDYAVAQQLYTWRGPSGQIINPVPDTLRGIAPPAVEYIQGHLEAVSRYQAAHIRHRAPSTISAWIRREKVESVWAKQERLVLLPAGDIHAQALAPLPPDLSLSPYDRDGLLKLGAEQAYYVLDTGMEGAAEQVRLGIELQILTGVRISELQALLVGQFHRLIRPGLPVLGATRDELPWCGAFLHQAYDQMKHTYGKMKNGRTRDGLFGRRVWDIYLRLVQLAQERLELCGGNPRWRMESPALPLLVGPDGRPLHSDVFTRAWDRGLLLCGFPARSRIELGRKHLFRHLHVCLLLEACSDPFTVAAAMAVKVVVIEAIYGTVPMWRRARAAGCAAALFEDLPKLATVGRGDTARELAQVIKRAQIAAADHDVAAVRAARRTVEQLAAEIREQCGEVVPATLTAWLHQANQLLIKADGDAQEDLGFEDDPEMALDDDGRKVIRL